MSESSNVMNLLKTPNFENFYSNYNMTGYKITNPANFGLPKSMIEMH